jgi:hypothetical protein
MTGEYVTRYEEGHRADGTFRHISVGMLQPRVGVARTRTGYYANRSGNRY